MNTAEIVNPICSLRLNGEIMPHGPLEWASALTSAGANGVFIRGIPVAELMGAGRFVSALLLLWSGNSPSDEDVELVEACLVACMDHGPATPSAIAARTAASTGNRPLPSAATGLLATGPLHGAAVSNCAELIYDAPSTGVEKWASSAVKKARRQGARVPGIGHRWHHEDPRTEVIFSLLDRQRRGSTAISAVQSLSAALSKETGKHQCVNVDGAVAVSIVVLGLPVQFGDCLFGIARLGGLSAHVIEESSRERPMRVISPSNVHYDGPIPVHEMNTNVKLD